jgi:c-di-GMP-binding flagellar brake protein YcgR
MGTPAVLESAPPAVEVRPRAARASLVHAVMCRYAGEVEFVEVTTMNISLSGMLFRVPSALPPVGSELEFKFILENGFELLSGVAQVMRHASEPNAKPAVGVAFLPLDPPKQRILARIIEIHSEPEPTS